MAFCSNCGNQVEGEFCPECGTKIEVENVVAQPEDTGAAAPAISPEVIDKVKKIAIPVVIVAVLAVIAVFLFKGPLNPVKNAANKYMQALKAGEGEKIVATMHPEYVAQRDDEFADAEYYDYDTYAEHIDEGYESFSDDYADEEDIDISKMKWKITKIKDVKKGDLKDIQKYFEKVCDVDVKAAKSVKLQIKDGDEKANMTIYLIKVKGKWYTLSYDHVPESFEYLYEQFKQKDDAED